MPADERLPILVVGPRTPIVSKIAAGLRRAGMRPRIVAAVSAAAEVASSSASAVIVAVEHAADWTRFCRLASLTRNPVVVVTPFFASDRRFRETAFAAGAAGYVRPPFTARGLAEVLRRVQAGERRVELVGFSRGRSAHASAGSRRGPVTA
jgi:AmiR/NasT family two-component response regulator